MWSYKESMSMHDSSVIYISKSCLFGKQTKIN